MTSHSKQRVAFCRLHLMNQSAEVIETVNSERWRHTWHYQSGDNLAAFRPTEEEAFANIFFDMRGINVRY